MNEEEKYDLKLRDQFALEALRLLFQKMDEPPYTPQLKKGMPSYVHDEDELAYQDARMILLAKYAYRMADKMREFRLSVFK